MMAVTGPNMQKLIHEVFNFKRKSVFNFLTIGWSVVKAIRLREKKVSNDDYPPSSE